MRNEQIANAYAIAKVLGVSLSVEEFQEKYSQYYNESLNKLNSNPTYAQCEAMDRRPF